MMNKRARVLITRDCHRKCEGCCSDYSPAMAGMKPIDILGLLKYESVTITGGEPMLFPYYVQWIVKSLRYLKPNIRIHLYTTLGSSQLCNFIEDELFDGITYTLHTPFESKDIRQLQNVQNALNGKEGSWRLKIEPNIPIKIKRIINEWVWTSVEILDWLDDGNCPIGEGEDLLFLTEEK